MLPPNDRQGSPILSFIVLEQFNAIRLVQSVHQSLAALSKVIRGATLLSSEVQKLASALLNQKVSQYYIYIYGVFLINVSGSSIRYTFVRSLTVYCKP